MTSKKKRTVLLIISALIAVCLVSIYGYERWGRHNFYLNFGVVEPGVLYRSGQPFYGDIKKINEKHGIKTIFCLSGLEKNEVEDYARESGIMVLGVSIPPGEVPSEKDIELFFSLMKGEKIRRKKYKDRITEWPGTSKGITFPMPVLIHCRQGKDRTGVMVALYRIYFQGWKKEEAKKEMLDYSHKPDLYPGAFDLIDDFKMKND